MERDIRRGRINAARGGLGAMWLGRHKWRPCGGICMGLMRDVVRAP